MSKRLDKINIDVIRFVVAFMIVAIHTYPLSSISETLDYSITRVLFRVGVPLFLMITGYYVIPKAKKDKSSLVSYTKKIFIMYLVAIIIYVPINIYNGHLKTLGIGTLLKELFIDGTFYHLWYFPGLILGLWILYGLVKRINLKVVLLICILLFVVGLFGDSYYGLIKDVPIVYSFYDGVFSIASHTRNGLFYVPVFLLIGYIISNQKSSNDSKRYLYIGIMSLIMMMVEGCVLNYNGIPKHNSMYVFLVPACYCLFKFIMASQVSSNRTLRNVATWIYIMHPFFIVAVRFASGIVGMEFIHTNSIINYVSVSFFSCVAAFVIVKLMEKVKGIRKN